MVEMVETGCQVVDLGCGVVSSLRGGSVVLVTNPNVFINVRAPIELRAAAVQSAREAGTTMSDICRDALTMFVAVHAAAGPVQVVEVVEV